MRSHREGPWLLAQTIAFLKLLLERRRGRGNPVVVSVRAVRILKD